MPETSGFFNSKVLDDGSYDRVYLAENFADYFASFVGNGVFANKLNALQVIVDSAMNVKVRAGQAWINGYWYENDSDLSLTLPTAPTTGYRTDSIVVRYGVTDRSIKCYVKEGTLNTANPAPTRNSEYYELVLAYVKVNAGTVTISQSMITDKRGDKSVCGYVTGLIDQIDTTDFYTQLNGWLEEYMNKTENQYDSFSSYLSQKKNTADSDLSVFEGDLNTLKTSATNDVNALIEEIRGLLDGDVATNLQNQIDKVKGDLSESNERISKTEQDVEPVKSTFVISPEQSSVTKTMYELPPMIPGHSYSLIAYCVDDEQKKVYVSKRTFAYTVTGEMTGSYLKKPTRCIEKIDYTLIDKSTFDVPSSALTYDVVPILGTELLSFSYFYLFKSGNDVVKVDENNYEYGLSTYDGLENPGRFFGDFVTGENAIEFPQIVLGIGHDSKYISKKINVVFSDVTDEGTIVRNKSIWDKVSSMENHTLRYSYAMALMALEGTPKMSLSDSTKFLIKGTRADGLKVFTDYGFEILIFRNIEYVNELLESNFSSRAYDIAVITDTEVKESLDMPQMSVPSLFGRMKLKWSSFQTSDTKTVTVNISVNQNYAEPPDPSEYTVVIKEYPKISPYTGRQQDGNWFR